VNAEVSGKVAGGFAVLEVRAEDRIWIGEHLAASNAISSVEEVAVRYPLAVPDDPAYPQQWHLKAIGASQARRYTDGKGVVVSVVDSGVAFEDYVDPVNGTRFGKAPDFADGAFLPGFNAFASSADAPSPHANDDLGHGTHIASTIAEATDNGLMAAGIAPGVSIMPVKICGPDPIPGQAYGCPTTDIAEGISWAVEHGADVINLSIGGGPSSLSSAERAALQQAEDAGVVVVAAAGNSTTGPGEPFLDYPAAVSTVISVGAVGIAGQKAVYSNWGVNEAGQLMDLVAPGGDPAKEGFTSAIFQQSYFASCLSHNQNFENFAVARCVGTSMAAAHVSGVAALILARYPGLTHTQVRETLRACALDLGTPGQDPQTGFGLVQASGAMIDEDRDNLPDCIDSEIASPTPTPLPPPDTCPDPTPSPSPTPVPTPSPSPTPTPTAAPTPTPLPSDTATPTDTPIPTDTPTTGSPTPTDAATPTDPATPSPTPAPTATPTPSPSPTPLPPVCGDVDCNGELDAWDALGVLTYYAQVLPYPACIGLGYVTCDGLLDLDDAVALLRAASGLDQMLRPTC
jgi:serine protease